MDPRTMIVNRIDLYLRQQLGVGVDTYRALTDAHYMRDVLLVCDAMRDTRLPLLARQFRVAGKRIAQEMERRPGHDAGPAQGWSANTSGFGVSRPFVLDAEGQRRPAKPWYWPKRWLGS
jgi:hypothetical protein